MLNETIVQLYFDIRQGELFLETEKHLYELNPAGFKIAEEEPEEKKRVGLPVTGKNIAEVKSDREYLIIRLHDNSFLRYGFSWIDGDGQTAPAMRFMDIDEVDNEFLGWFNNDFQALDMKKNYYRIG